MQQKDSRTNCGRCWVGCWPLNVLPYFTPHRGSRGLRQCNAACHMAMLISAKINLILSPRVYVSQGFPSVGVVEWNRWLLGVETGRLINDRRVAKEQCGETTKEKVAHSFFNKNCM